MHAVASYFSLVLIVTCAFGTAPAIAADDPEICHIQSGKTAIEACNWVINSGKYPKNTIADAYTSPEATLRRHAMNGKTVSVAMRQETAAA
jgi:hypothetical protein